MAKTDGLGRRDFLKAGAAAGAAAMSARSYAQAAGANDRLRMAFIGCGGMAGEHLGSLLHMMKAERLDIVATCDVYTARAEDFADRIERRGARPEVHQDYRRVLERTDVDYVLVAAPEHAHAHITLDALDAGKHVYCEKPLTHTIGEAQAVVKKAAETGLKLQVGVQSMADDSYLAARRAILEGKLGMVVQAQVDYVRNYTDEGPWRTKLGVGDAKPDNLDWAAWLVGAPEHAWDPHHYEEWRCYSQYSGGIATDLFIHRVTRILKACNLGFPSRVAGMGGIYTWADGRDLPDSFELLAEYPAVEGITKGMTLYTLGTMANDDANDHLIRGTEGTLKFTDAGWEIRHDKSGEVIATHKKTGGEDVTPHHKNHHAAIREGAELNCPPELGLYGVALCCMANQSWREGRMLAWDAAQGRVV